MPMLTAITQLGLCLLLQDNPLPPATDQPDAPVTTFAAPPTEPAAVPDAVLDQLIGFDSEKVVEIQEDPVQVRVMGAGRVGTIKVQDVRTPVLGRDRHELGWMEFYRRVGRPDLADRYRLYVLGRLSLGGGGLALSLGSALPFMLAMTLGLGVIFWERGARPQSGQAFTPFTLVGLATILAGAAVMVVMTLVGSSAVWFSLQVPRQPIADAEILELAQHHNRAVLDAAGLPASTPLP